MFSRRRRPRMQLAIEKNEAEFSKHGARAKGGNCRVTDDVCDGERRRDTRFTDFPQVRQRWRRRQLPGPVRPVDVRPARRKFVIAAADIIGPVEPQEKGQLCR